MRALRIGGFAVVAIVGVVILTLLISSMAIFGWGFWTRSTADYRGQTAAIERTKADADFRISSYQKFFDLCGRVQAQEDRIRILADSTSPNAATDLVAVRSIRADLVREYNNLATRDFTEGQFRASQLPYQLAIDNEETSCGS